MADLGAVAAVRRDRLERTTIVDFRGNYCFLVDVVDAGGEKAIAR